MMAVTIHELLSVSAVIVIPGAVVWTNTLVRLGKLETRAEAKEKRLERIEEKLDKLLNR